MDLSILDALIGSDTNQLKNIKIQNIKNDKKIGIRLFKKKDLLIGTCGAGKLGRLFILI